MSHLVNSFLVEQFSVLSLAELDIKGGALYEHALNMGMDSVKIKRIHKKYISGDTTKALEILDSYTRNESEVYKTSIEKTIGLGYNNPEEILSVYRKFRSTTDITSSNYKEISYVSRFIEWIEISTEPDYDAGLELAQDDE